MTDLDKMTVSIEKLQPNSEYNINSNSDTVDETLFNSIVWTSSNSLTWSEVLEEMNKL